MNLSSWKDSSILSLKPLLMMSVLIDGTVAEARELGIETMTPDQLERMKAAWRENDDKAV